MLIFSSIGRGFMKVGKTYLEPLILNFAVLGKSSCNKSHPLSSLVQVYKEQLELFYSILEYIFDKIDLLIILK